MRILHHNELNKHDAQTEKKFRIEIKSDSIRDDLCDRLLLSFKAVAPTALFIRPIFINSKTFAVDLTGCMLASGTANPLG